jgi:class 3 adenylate cyclase
MHDGVVVDYWGDAVMAMFGAPETQPDHAVRACRAACQMLAQITMLNQKHQALTKGQFNLGIGINSGIARVGNTGSSIKFKYGPLGNTVNVASRIESITKKFGVTCLISQSTQRYLQSEFCSRRIAQILVQGIPEPVDIHQLLESNSMETAKLCHQYELALQEFEAGNITDSISLLGGLIKRWSNDLPSKLLLQRCTERLTSNEPFDPIWIMDQK